jgi:hypothetical protein
MSALTQNADRTALERSRVDLALVAIVSCTIAVLHVSAAVGHWDESQLYGIAFVLLAITQFSWGYLLVTTDRLERALELGIILNVGVIAVYALSRTVGLPIGADLGHPETIGIHDAAATLDEITLILLSLSILRHRPLSERAYAIGGLLVFATLLVFTAFSHVS